jgi:hypothetical protein
MPLPEYYRTYRSDGYHFCFVHYHIDSTLHHYKDKSVNVVYGNNNFFYYENYMNTIKQSVGKMQSCWMLKQVVHILPRWFQRLKNYKTISLGSSYGFCGGQCDI